MKHRILIVDDEPNVRLNYRVTLETEGFEVHEASDGGAALRELAGKDFDLAVLDLRMPEMDGLVFADRREFCGLSGNTACRRRMA